MDSKYYNVTYNGKNLGRFERESADICMKKNNLTTIEDLLFYAINLYFEEDREQWSFSSKEEALEMAIKKSEIIIAGDIQVYKNLCEMLSPYISADIIERKPFEICHNCSNCYGQLCISDMTKIDPFKKGCGGWTPRDDDQNEEDSFLEYAKYVDMDTIIEKIQKEHASVNENYKVIIGGMNYGVIKKKYADEYMKKHNIHSLLDLVYYASRVYLQKSYPDDQIPNKKEDILELAEKESNLTKHSVCDSIEQVIINDLTEGTNNIISFIPR